MRLSFAHIVTYLECPKRYAYRYRDGLTEPLSWQASFGTSLHNTLYRFTKEVQGDRLWSSLSDAQGVPRQTSLFGDAGPSPPPVERLLELLDSSWVNVGYPEAQAMYAAKAEALTLLRRWYGDHAAELQQTVAVELPFRLSLGEVEIQGRMDRIDRRDGELMVVDYKSGSLRTQEEVDGDRQLGMYALVLHEMLGLDSVRLGLYFLRDDLMLETRRDTQACAQTRETIHHVARRVSAERFDATPSLTACSRCPFRSLCPDSLCNSPSPE